MSDVADHTPAQRHPPNRALAVPPRAGRRDAALWAGRATAGAIAALAAGSVVAMVCASMLQGGLGQVAATAWRAAGYFTNLTALLVAYDLARVAAGREIGAGRAAGPVVWMAMIAAVYHLILAPQWRPTGLILAADVALHTALPAMVAVWWLVFAPKAGLRRADVAVWLIWPLIYAAYALIRGLMTGFWPYPFADLDRLGAMALSANVLALTAGFAALGAALVALARRVPDPPNLCR